MSNLSGLGTFSTAWRPDNLPLLTQRVYSLSKLDNERELLVNRGFFPKIDLGQGEPAADDLKHRLQGTIVTWSGKEAFGSIMDTRMGPGDERPIIGLDNPGTITYSTIPRGLKAQIDDMFVAEQQVPLPIEELSAKALRAQHAVAREYRIASNLRTNGNTSTFAAAGYTKLDATDDPIKQLLEICDDIEDASPSLSKPSALVLSRTVGRSLRNQPQIRGLEGDVTAGLAMRADGTGPVRSFEYLERVLSTHLGMRVVVATGRYNTAKAGQTASMSDIWSGIQFLWDDNADAVVTDADVGGQVNLEKPRTIICPFAGAAMGRFERPEPGRYWLYMDERVGETLVDTNLAWHYSSVVG